MCISCKKKLNFYEIANIFIGPPHSDLITPLHHAGGKHLRKQNPDCVKSEYISHFFLPHSISFLKSQNSFLEPHCVHAALVPNLFAFLYLTFPVCSTCIFSIHPSCTCPMCSDLLVLLYINLVSIPLLCPISYILPQHLFFLSGLYRTASTSKIIPLPFKSFSNALFPFQLLLSNLLPYVYFYMLLSFVFMQSSDSSSVKESTNYTSLEQLVKTLIFPEVSLHSSP